MVSSRPRLYVPSRRRQPGAFLHWVRAWWGAWWGGGGYTGARTDKPALRDWHTIPGSADGDTLGDLTTLRARSRDLGRNNPLAAGAVATQVTNVVGTGLWPCATPNTELLGIDAATATQFGRRAEMLFNVWADSEFCDAARATTFAGLQEMAFRGVLESGDTFVLRRYLPRPGGVVGLALQLVEADRCQNPPGVPETLDTAAGISVDGTGAPLRYHFSTAHPGDRLAGLTGAAPGTSTVSAFGAASGERQVLHLYRKLRPDQRRGVPYLAPVIEPLRQLDRYSEAELAAAVIGACFTTFVKTERDEGLVDADAKTKEGAGAEVAPARDIRLTPGKIVDLNPGESVEFAHPARPSAQFDPFWLAVVRQIGMALEIPYEVLIRHFSSSYSASRAALESAWQHFRVRRAWLAGSFCQPVWEWFIAEAVARGLLTAPGFEDPLRRAAWCGATWIGDARISLDPLKDANADAIAEAHGWKTAEQITAERTGGDWRRNLQVRAQEVALRRASGLAPAATPIPPTPPDDPTEADDARNAEQ